MPKVRHYADLVATLAGLMWLMLYWSISISLHIGTPEPALAALLALGSMILVSFAHRPVRVMLSRYHVRKRRTEMWMHILALPLTLAFLFAIVIDHLLTPMNGAQKMLLFNVLATASWLVFLVTLLGKLMIRNVQDRRGRDDDTGADADADTTAGTGTGIASTSDETPREAQLEASVASAPPPGHEDASQRDDETPASDATDTPSDTTPPRR